MFFPSSNLAYYDAHAHTSIESTFVNSCLKLDIYYLSLTTDIGNQESIILTWKYLNYSARYDVFVQKKLGKPPHVPIVQI